MMDAAERTRARKDFWNKLKTDEGRGCSIRCRYLHMSGQTKWLMKRCLLQNIDCIRDFCSLARSYRGFRGSLSDNAQFVNKVADCHYKNERYMSRCDSSDSDVEAVFEKRCYYESG